VTLRKHYYAAIYKKFENNLYKHFENFHKIVKEINFQIRDMVLLIDKMYFAKIYLHYKSVFFNYILFF